MDTYRSVGSNLLLVHPGGCRSFNLSRFLLVSNLESSGLPQTSAGHCYGSGHKNREMTVIDGVIDSFPWWKRKARLV